MRVSMNRVDTNPPKKKGRWLHWINVPLVVVLAWITLQWTGCSQRGPFPEESLDDPAAIPSQEAIAALQTGPTVPMTGTNATAVFAAGCFWSTEAAFKQLKGVHAVTSGFAGGSKETANYRRVCEGDTGHAEAVRISYDPRKITYDRLLDVFFDAHDPTQLNRQDNDVGTQYRSAIFYANETERRAAESKIRQLTQAKVLSSPIVTTLEPLTAFYPAEDYHQDYVRQHLDQPYIRFHALPKVRKVGEKHPDLVRRADAERSG